MNKTFSESEISFKEIYDYIKGYRNHFKLLFKVVISTVLLFALLGYFMSLFSSVEFESNAKLLNESSENSSSGTSVKDMAIKAVLGNESPANSLDENNKSDLYSLIVFSKPFLLELSHKRLPFQTQKVSTFQYFTQKPIEDSFFEKLKNKFGDEKRIINYNTTNSKIEIDTNQYFISIPVVKNVTLEENNIIEILKSRIKIKNSGNLINVAVLMPDKNLSAHLNKELITLLMKYMSIIKLNKQLENIKFLELRTTEARYKYVNSQRKLASLKDSNLNSIFQSVQSNQEYTQNEFNLYSTIYNQLMSQLEQAKIQLKKDTPIFTFVEPIYIPQNKIVDNSVITRFTVIGLIVGIVIWGILLVYPLINK
ncbi:hypothetical protein ACMH5Q_11360 [Aquirufa lenticrescens]